MQLAEILTAGREVIADPKNWTKGWFARAKDGTQVFPDDPKATCFCSVGALSKVADGISARGRAISFLNQVAAPNGIVHFNDGKTHDEVLAMWDKAIALANNE